MQRSLIGVGPALKKARLRRGVTIDEAGRSTKIRPDYLEALEREAFEVLLGEVYVRGALRSYASYLGLDPDKVLSIYANHDATPDPQRPEPPSELKLRIGDERRQQSHRLAILVVVIVALVAAGFGVLSARNAAPEAASLPRSSEEPASLAAKVIVGVTALRDVRVLYTADGLRRSAQLLAGEGRSFEARDILTLRVPGRAAEVTVNGATLGVVGIKGKPWERSFAPTSVVSPSPTSATTKGQEGIPSPSA